MDQNESNTLQDPHCGNPAEYICCFPFNEQGQVAHEHLFGGIGTGTGTNLLQKPGLQEKMIQIFMSWKQKRVFLSYQRL